MIVSSSKPTVLTQYPRDQKCSPVTRRIFNNSRWIRTALLPFKNPIVYATLYFGGILKHMCMWSGIRWPSIISTLFCRHSSLKIFPTPVRNFPYSLFFRNFGTITTWYLQSHLTWDKLSQSLIGSSSTSPLWGSPGGRTYFISPRIGRTSPGPPAELVGLAWN